MDTFDDFCVHLYLEIMDCARSEEKHWGCEDPADHIRIALTEYRKQIEDELKQKNERQR